MIIRHFSCILLSPCSLGMPKTILCFFFCQYKLQPTYDLTRIPYDPRKYSQCQDSRSLGTIITLHAMPKTMHGTQEKRRSWLLQDRHSSSYCIIWSTFWRGRSHIRDQGIGDCLFYRLHNGMQVLSKL